MIEMLPHLNATLNAVATVLLVVGLLLIKRGDERLHKATMVSAFAVSAVFLVCYLIHKAFKGTTEFPREAYPTAAYGYYALLISHFTLAMAVPVLAIWAIVLGFKDRREQHRKIAKWAFPIWLYVSVTGVLVYFMLYWWFPPVAEAPEPAVSAVIERAAEPSVAGASSGLRVNQGNVTRGDAA